MLILAVTRQPARRRLAKLDASTDPRFFVVDELDVARSILMILPFLVPHRGVESCEAPGISKLEGFASDCAVPRTMNS